MTKHLHTAVSRRKRHGSKWPWAIGFLIVILIGTSFLTPTDAFATVHYFSNGGSDNEEEQESNPSASRWPRSEMRPKIDLDGEWGFRTDPDNVGQRERWFDPSVLFEETILVPGAWDAQGVGEETDKVNANYVGKAWYRRTIAIPRSWLGKHIFLYIGGVHRYADIWVNGEHVRRHVGYVVDFEIDLTKHISPGEDVTIAIRVDSAQDWDIDALTGTLDIIDYMFVNWGGIYQHVWLEVRDNEWIEDAFVKPNVADSVADVEVTIHAKTACERRLVAEVIGPEGNIAASVSRQVNLLAGNSRIDLALVLSDPLLWSPNHPWLYRLRLSLHDDARQTDEWENRFGMREIEIRGADIYLNGKKIYLHGYGDDTVYPKTICPPAEHEEYRKRLALVKEFNFNYVRHHSAVPLPEYFDVADELGILVQPELPVAYEIYLTRGLEHETSRELYLETWRGMIRRYRNHPSLFGWCMGNEIYEGNELAGELYDIAKLLDPTRPVYDTDGVGPGTDRPTLDVLMVQFDVHALPVVSRTVKHIEDRQPMHPLLKPVTLRTEKHRLEPPPAKPVISHEMGNFVTYPNVHDAEQFTHTVKPFWLLQARAALEERGILDQAEWLAENSGNLQALCHKINIENQRMSPHTDGHALWLFQDYWTTSNGLVNTYYQVKSLGPEWYTKFIADVVLLADMPGYTFIAGDQVDIPLLISDYGEEDIVDGELSWSLRRGAEVLAWGDLPRVTIVEKGVSSLSSVSLSLPRMQRAEKLNITVTLNSTAGKVENDWNIWVFPQQDGLSLPASMSIAQIGLDYISAEYPEIVPIGQNGGIPEDTDLLLARSMSKPILDYLERGGKVLLTTAWPLFETELSTFEPAWWKGEPIRDASAGTIIYDSPVFAEFPHEGWCDLQFLELIDGQYVMLLDDIPGARQPIVRAIDTYTSSRHKSYLAEWRVGGGSLLVSTFNLKRDVIKLPEVRWLLRSLVRYGLSKEFSPEAVLSVEYVAKHMGNISNRPVISSPLFKYYYYEGDWSAIPAYLSLTPLDSGYVSQIRLKEIKFTDRESYALLFYGYIKIEREGKYTFYTASNDGSLLLVNNIKVVDNSGNHALQEKSGNIYLKPGVHFLEIRYFQMGGGQELRVSYEGPGLKKQEIQPSIFTGAKKSNVLEN